MKFFGTESLPSLDPTDRVVVAVDDGTELGVTAVLRALRHAPRAVVLAPYGRKGLLQRALAAVDLPTQGNVRWVSKRHVTLQLAFELCRVHSATWLSVPAAHGILPEQIDMALRLTPALINDGLRGIALHLVRSKWANPLGALAPEPARLAYQRVVEVSDVEESSGFTAYSAASVAARAGAELSVLLLGADEAVAETAQLAAAMSIRRDPDQFEWSRRILRTANIPVTYVSVGKHRDSATMIRSAINHLGRLRPDLVVLELGNQELRPGPDGSVHTDEVFASTRGKLVSQITEEFSTDLAIVFDAVSIGAEPLVPSAKIIRWPGGANSPTS